MTAEPGFQVPERAEFPQGRDGKFLSAEAEPANYAEMIEALTAVGVSLGVAKRTIDRLGDTRLDRVSELLGRTLDQYWRASRAFPRVPHVPEPLTWGRTPPLRAMPQRTTQDGTSNG
ncbi:MAG: hypothetical protein J0H19_06115 [Rhodospirillales bacterium]|nr:hypothetical protein [Rhodospirillales bacterium]